MTSLLRFAARVSVAVLVSVLTFSGSLVAAQEVSPGLRTEIDSLYRAFATENHLPGIAYGIILDTSLVYAGATGYSNLTDSTPVMLSTTFRAASMTKSFTALAILKLRDEGKLGLDDPVHNYLPELKNLKYLTSDAPVLTIRHLLTHMGGFPQDDPWADRQLETTEEELNSILAEGVSMSNVPGISYEYSNLGYTLLGRVIKAVSGESYQEYIAANIFKPLGMRSTVWEYAGLPEGVMAHGYRHRNGEWSEEPLLHDGPFGAMGGLISTVGDFARYAIMHLSAWPPGKSPYAWPAVRATDEGPAGDTPDGRLVKRSTLREMHSPSSGVEQGSGKLYPGGPDCNVTVAYGYGLRWSLDCLGRRKIYHNGGLPGFGSNWTIMPDYGIGIVAFSNRTYGSTWAVNQKVLELIIEEREMQPRAIAVSDILRTRMNDLVRILPGWNVTGRESIFADNFFADYDIEELRTRAARIFREAGEIKHIREIVPENSLRGSFVMEGESGSITVVFTLTPEATPGIQAFTIAFTPNRSEK
jgi:CubicO group peptidase (beta-lactamase class C family)